MKTYKVHVILDYTIEDLEAEDENDAFVQASDLAMAGGLWQWDCEEVDGEEESEDKE